MFVSGGDGDIATITTGTWAIKMDKLSPKRCHLIFANCFFALASPSCVLLSAGSV